MKLFVQIIRIANERRKIIHVHEQQQKNLCLENEDFKELKWLIYRQLLNSLLNFTSFIMSIYFNGGKYQLDYIHFTGLLYAMEIQTQFIQQSC